MIVTRRALKWLLTAVQVLGGFPGASDSGNAWGFEHWQNGEEPPRVNVGNGTFEHWQNGELL